MALFFMLTEWPVFFRYLGINSNNCSGCMGRSGTVRYPMDLSGLGIGVFRAMRPPHFVCQSGLRPLTKFYSNNHPKKNFIKKIKV